MEIIRYQYTQHKTYNREEIAEPKEATKKNYSEKGCECLCYLCIKGLFFLPFIKNSVYFLNSVFRECVTYIIVRYLRIPTYIYIFFITKAFANMYINNYSMFNTERIEFSLGKKIFAELQYPFFTPQRTFYTFSNK